MTDFARPMEAAAPPFAKTLLPLLALALAMAVGFTMMGAFGTVQEGAKAELHLSDYTLSLIQGLSAALPLAVFSIPIGIMVDRYNRVRMMIALAFVWTLGTVLTGLAHSVPLLFVARMLTGIGTTGALTAALSLCADFCVPTQRGRAMLIVNLGKSLGVALALALSGALFGLFAHGRAPAWFAGMMPWRSVHLCLAVVSVLAILPLFLLREPVRQEVAAGTHAPFKVVAGELWARREFQIPAAASAITTLI